MVCIQMSADVLPVRVCVVGDGVDERVGIHHQCLVARLRDEEIPASWQPVELASVVASLNKDGNVPFISEDGHGLVCSALLSPVRAVLETLLVGVRVGPESLLEQSHVGLVVRDETDDGESLLQSVLQPEGRHIESLAVWATHLRRDDGVELPEKVHLSRVLVLVLLQIVLNLCLPSRPPKMTHHNTLVENIRAEQFMQHGEECASPLIGERIEHYIRYGIVIFQFVDHGTSAVGAFVYVHGRLHIAQIVLVVLNIISCLLSTGTNGNGRVKGGFCAHKFGECRPPLVQPEMAPPGRRHKISEPLMTQLMGHDVGYILLIIHAVSSFVIQDSAPSISH